MPGGNGSFDKLLVLNATSGGFGGSTVFTGTRLLGVLNFAMAVDTGKAGAEED